MKKLLVIAALITVFMMSCATAPTQESQEPEFLGMVVQAEDAVYEGEIVLGSEADEEEEFAPVQGDSLYMMGSGQITFTYEIEEAGDYLCKLFYAIPASFGDKAQNILVNGEALGEMNFVQSGGEWISKTIGILPLEAGTNEITVAHSWGYTWFDYMTLEAF